MALAVTQSNFSLRQRERLNRKCSKDWTAEPCFTSLQTADKPVNKPTGEKRTAL